MRKKELKINDNGILANAPNGAPAPQCLLNSKTKIAVILGIGMVLTLNGCQKEANEDWLPIDDTSYETQSVAHLCYHLDDEVYHVTINGDAAWTNLMHYLCSQARQGRHVLVYNEDNVSAIVNKEVVHYESKTEEEMISWMKKMSEENYNVQFVYDAKRDVYIGTATK